MTKRRIAAAVGIASLLLLGASCGKAAEKVGEKASEKAFEKSMGDDAKVDIDRNGGYTVKDKDGGEYSVGTKSKLPADWPSEMAIPKGFTVQSVI